MSKLGAVRPVTYRKMFGGAGVYLDGLIVAVLDNDRVYLKIDDVTEGRYIEAGMERFVYDPESGASMPYREVPAEVWQTPEVLAEWVDEALEAAKRKKSARKR